MLNKDAILKKIKKEPERPEIFAKDKDERVISLGEDTELESGEDEFGKDKPKIPIKSIEELLQEKELKIFQQNCRYCWSKVSLRIQSCQWSANR